MKKATQKGTERSESDKAKRVYRAAVDCIKRLDEILKQKKAYRQVFLQDAVGLRGKLKEYCERLMFFNPLDYGRKAEEVLWRKVFYDVIQLVKHNRRHVRAGSSLETAFRTHLSAASGYYCHLIFRLQHEFALKLDNLLDFHLVPEKNAPVYLGKKLQTQPIKRKDVEPAVQDWAVKACHRSLICLGDIARYQQEFDHGASVSSAERYYHQALALLPDVGMPHNQLGTLSGPRYLHCEAAYYYIRCMVCEKPFEGAEGNLKRLFEKNSKRYEELEQSPVMDLHPDEQRPHDMKDFFIRFLHLLDIFFDKTKSADAHEIQECCQATLHSFNLCMFYEPVAYATEARTNENLQYMDDDIVYKLVVICMATIYLLQKRGSRQVTAAIAFLLALFSHILNHIVIRLQGALYEKENPNKLLLLHQEMDGTEEGDEEDELIEAQTVNDKDKATENELFKAPEEAEDPNSKLNDAKKSRQSRLKSFKRRRRKRYSNSDLSDSSDLSEMSDLSEGNEEIDENHYLSEESEEEVVGFYDNNSDSDLSDNLMESQELKPGFAMDRGDNDLDEDNHIGGSGMGSFSNIWLDTSANDSLAQFSTELFSSTTTLLGQDYKLANSQNFQLNENDVELYENCNDIIQAKRDVSVPPGFDTTTEAQQVAEITQKMTNFVIETDTEATLSHTDTEQSGFTETDTESSVSSVVDRAELEQKHLQRLLDTIQNEGLFPVVKIMGDWMMCNDGVIMTCAQSSQSLWCRLSVLLSLLPPEKSMADHDQCWSDDLKTVLTSIHSTEWKQVLPLREDINLRLFLPLRGAHDDIDFVFKRRAQLTEIQETFLRIACLRKFGYFLSSLDNLNFLYVEDQNVFIGPSHVNSSAENEKLALERMADAESRRNQLMRDMAQLRLQAEVNQLEGSIQTSDHMTFPPYLIPDTLTLCQSLHHIKQLTNSGRGIIVIPLAVIDTLDFLKKESVGAREAIRWLEAEFRKGNRYIRAQKSNEKLQSNSLKNIKKKNRDMWCLHEILDCARYLAQQGGDLSTGSMVAVLSTRELDTTDMPSTVRQVISSCRQQGISMENISSFANKWKDLWKNKG